MGTGLLIRSRSARYRQCPLRGRLPFHDPGGTHISPPAKYSAVPVADPVFAQAKRLEGALWDQKRLIESLPPKHKAMKQLETTATHSRNCAVIQTELERAEGKEHWPEIKGKALGIVREAHHVLQDNIALGLGGWNWQAQQATPVAAFRAQHGV
jgi:hypothetical protein